MSRNKKIILIDGVMLLIVIFAVTFFVILKPDYKKVVSNTTSMESVSIVKVRNELDLNINILAMLLHIFLYNQLIYVWV